MGFKGDCRESKAVVESPSSVEKETFYRLSAELSQGHSGPDDDIRGTHAAKLQSRVLRVLPSSHDDLLADLRLVAFRLLA